MASRFRCNACGNLTRFDVVATRRTKSFHHFSIGGDLLIEDEEMLSEQVEQVTCRWCGNSKAIEELPDPGSEAATGAGAEPETAVTTATRG
ncbi:MAG: hypothetical protein ACLQK4_08175 [Acidimicrobiales bacterium]|jgi:hypothetical protein